MPYLDSARHVYFRHWDRSPADASVLLLHGFGEHSGHYHRLAYGLNNRGLDVWGLDHLGHGLSDGVRGQFRSVDALANNASLLLDAIEADFPDRPLFVVGHSLGGVTAALLAARGRRFDGLVLTGAPLSGLPRQIAPDPIMSEDPFYLDALENDPLSFDTAPAEPALWRAIGARVAELRTNFSRIDDPVLFIHGDRDAFAPPHEAQAWAAQLARAEVITLNGHHDIVNDLSHREVERQIDAFIRLAVRSSREPAAAAR
jgi:alpha-beta hydrolase superfamily lysophospholipase